METSKPGSSSTDSASVIDLTNDLGEAYGTETHNLLRQIVHGLYREINEPENALKPNSSLKRASRLTGFHPKILARLSTSEALMYVCREIDRNKIHQAIISHCLSFKSYPSLNHLFSELCEHMPSYIDKQSFIRMLLKMGYIFKKQANSYTPCVAEKPEITFERYLYLNNIKNYRLSNRLIFFVGEASASWEGRVFNLDQTEAYCKSKPLVPFMFIISSGTGIINLHIVDELNISNFHCWITNEVIPRLPVNSVVVLDNTKHHNAKLCEPPQMNSLKVEMKEWLEYHHVPHTNNMSKMQLWELVEKYTDIEANVFVIDNILKAHGHEVLRLPDCINELSLATGVRHFIRSILYQGKTGIVNIKESLNYVGKRDCIMKELKMYNHNLIKEELKLLQFDTEFDKVVDEIESSNTSEFSYPLDSLCQDNIELPYFSDSE